MHEEHDRPRWDGDPGSPPDPDWPEAGPLSHEPAWPNDPAAHRDDVPAAFSAYPALRYGDEAEGLAADLLEPRGPTAPPPGRRVRRGIGIAFMVFGGSAAVFVLLYLLDLLMSIGDVPRGVTVAGVEVGGMSRAAAESTLRRELQPRLTDPLPVRAGDVSARLDPTSAGLGLDWAGTVERAGSQPLNPLTRLTSFFVTREVGVAATTDDERLRAALGTLATERINHGVTEGGVGFRAVAGGDGAVRPYAIQPRQGQWLTDFDAAMAAVKAGWLTEDAVTVPVHVTPARTSPAGVREALDRTRPLVSGPVTVRGAGSTVALTPKQIGDALRYTPIGDGDLRMDLDRASLERILSPRLRGTEQQAADARIVFASSGPSVAPAEPGRDIDWQRTFAPFFQVAGRQQDRVLPVVYNVRSPGVSTQELASLGIKEVVGEFTTDGLEGAVAQNVETIAAAVNGAVVRPGETFSLDARTGSRTASQGYVTAPLHEDGSGPPVIGGGVSQFTSTLYNAAYLAGLGDAGHTHHTHYVDRYPPARDAVSLRDDGSSVDLSFTNDLARGVAVQAFTDGDSVTVRIWGTRQYRVESSTGPRTDIEAPPVDRQLDASCTPSPGAEGFTVSDTRVLYDVGTGREVRRETQAVRYEPVVRVVCGPPPTSPEEPEPTPPDDPTGTPPEEPPRPGPPASPDSPGRPGTSEPPETSDEPETSDAPENSRTYSQTQPPPETSEPPETTEPSSEVSEPTEPPDTDDESAEEQDVTVDQDG
ncbi:VanW family protein [Prauserella oleivorans]|uniref:VanW family protein n=1 Tax=Prauserella oleivorans TaxID=1478153 RepID=A0ABW5WHW1_9PSEU